MYVEVLEVEQGVGIASHSVIRSHYVLQETQTYGS